MNPLIQALHDPFWQFITSNIISLIIGLTGISITLIGVMHQLKKTPIKAEKTESLPQQNKVKVSYTRTSSTNNTPKSQPVYAVKQRAIRKAPFANRLQKPKEPTVFGQFVDFFFKDFLLSLLCFGLFVVLIYIIILS